MEWYPSKSTNDTFPLKRLLKEEPFNTKKKKCISISLSKSCKKKQVNSASTAIATTTTTSTNSSQQNKHGDKKKQQSKEHIKIESTESPKLEQYACPICEVDLTDIKSSYLRQNHVEACISSSPTVKEEETLEFDDCVFCGKKLSRFNSNQRQVHLNNCLDEIKEDPVEAETNNEGMFAGQRVPFLDTLEICPVCHENTPFINKTLKQKIQHIKQCARQNKLSLNQLLKKFQWIGWGHLLIASASTNNTNTTTSLTNNNIPSTFNSLNNFQTPYKPSHRLMVSGFQDNWDMYDVDGDFSEDVIIHKTNQRVPKATKEEDINDEELQTILAISRSMMKTETKVKKKKIGIRPSDEREWNAANIFSMDESRKKAIQKLDELLFSENELEVYQQNEREKSIGDLGPSRLFITPSMSLTDISKNTDISFWNLASNRDSNWDEPLIFESLFLRKLK